MRRRTSVQILTLTVSLLLLTSFTRADLQAALQGFFLNLEQDYSCTSHIVSFPSCLMVAVHDRTADAKGMARSCILHVPASEAGGRRYLAYGQAEPVPSIRQLCQTCARYVSFQVQGDVNTLCANNDGT